MQKYRRALFVFLCLTVHLGIASAQNESPLQLGTDVVSRYVWRGVNLGGSSPCIQPWIKYNIATDQASSVLSIGTWGSYTFSKTSNQEVDIYVAYTYKKLISITVTDYFFPDLFEGGERSQYFNYRSDNTCHVFEGSVGFNGTDQLPFTVLVGMNFYGNDARKIADDGHSGQIFMTKYVELGYKKNIKGVDLNAFIGGTLDKPDSDKGEIGFYGNKNAGIINLGIKVAKSLPITGSYSVPIQASLITNPESQSIFLVFGISF